MSTNYEKQLAPHVRGVDPEYGKPDENGFVGVAPEYSNAANETDEPYQAPGDDVAELADAGVNNQFEFADAQNEDKDEDSDDKDDDKAKAKKLSTPPVKTSNN